MEKGYNRTTARDIASEAGVSLAAIGYHFTSKDALLTEALVLAFGEWDQELQSALQTGVSSDVSSAQRFEATWAKLIATFETHRPLWIANFEIFTQMISQPETRLFLASHLHAARTGLAAMFLNREESRISNETSRTIGTFHHVLLSGLLLQWLIDPTNALSAKDLTLALSQTARGLARPQESFWFEAQELRRENRRSDNYLYRSRREHHHHVRFNARRSRLILHRHGPRTELQPAHELQSTCIDSPANQRVWTKGSIHSGLALCLRRRPKRCLHHLVTSPAQRAAHRPG